MTKTKNIEEQYRKLSDIEHVLLRPGMYIGSTVPKTMNEFILVGDKFTKTDVTYIPGFLKLFDELLSNSVDEHKRNPNLNEIRVVIDMDKNAITIWDNGGIPVVEHKEHKQYIPEMIFSNLKAGSNFNDDEDRVVAGTNGVGSTLTNIFSQEFKVITADGTNKFVQKFTNNMQNKTKPAITRNTSNFTEITYFPELTRFKMNSIDEDHFEMLRKRIHEVAGCNSNLKLKLISVKDKKKNSETIKYRTFKSYVGQYLEEFFYEGDEKWQIAVAPSNDGHQQVSYVNTVETKDGGTHVNYITWQIIHALRSLIKKKHKIDVKPSELKQHMFIFVNAEIVNSIFESQTKEKLITDSKDFGSEYIVSEKTIKKIFASEVTKSILDWYEQKKTADEKRELRKLNKDLSNKKVLKLIDAKKRGDRESCTLGIYEGLSALSAVRKFRDAQTCGAFPLRGKFINVHELSNSKIIKNTEVQELMASIGLKLGEDAVNLRFGKILIYTDADVDGNSISGLLINFFYKFWPDLFSDGRMFKVMTPIVVASKGKTELKFYTQTEFDTWSKTVNEKLWNISYKKGLASLEDKDYSEIIKNPKMVQLTNDQNAANNLKAWFGSDSQPRKDKLLDRNTGTTELF